MAGPLTAGLQAAGPLLAGPLMAGSQIAGPLVAGPQMAGSQMAGLQMDDGWAWQADGCRLMAGLLIGSAC
jgi:hypothetical protein